MQKKKEKTQFYCYLLIQLNFLKFWKFGCFRIRHCNGVHNSLFLSRYNFKCKNNSTSVESLIVAEFERICVGGTCTLRISLLSALQFTEEKSDFKWSLLWYIHAV